MSIPGILTFPQDEYARGAFAFDHANAHRDIIAHMAPLERYSTMPTMVDPQQNLGGWLMDHQTSHDNFRVELPVSYGVGWWQQGTQEYGINSTLSLMDVNLDNADQMQWWLWVNHMDHHIASGLLDLSLGHVYPFW